MARITVRLETEADHHAVDTLIRDAFWGYTTPACDEHFLTHLVRKSPGFVPDLALLAEADGAPAGYILYSMAHVVMPDGRERPVLNFGPLCAHPSFRNVGVGSALMRHSIAEAARLGHEAIVFFGHPDYYPRFGFKRAGEFGILAHSGKQFDAHMAMELVPGALSGLEGGIFREDAAFAGLEDKAAFARFERRFPPRAPADMLPIEPLLERLNPEAWAAVEARKLGVVARLTMFSGREMAAWPGMDDEARAAVDAALHEAGFPGKLWVE